LEAFRNDPDPGAFIVSDDLLSAARTGVEPAIRSEHETIGASGILGKDTDCPVQRNFVNSVFGNVPLLLCLNLGLLEAAIHGCQ